ncbi:uncharacterized protein K452DRAFT_311995 [Aplosporella prunicola CBS 121167]|uniref:Uncharacterized protein n=1 Tax=Aplosporella prunicola CBS 121167 TaxID=1176127 RepID=A0A6A6B218_9PEZI|nr:uncharacterized protein K452DRAFT_311995 [Aplosporella prunicola CBS 121167]KAF2137856.1 hypothetical protein K452DRAFT_311995 [Aplosporella prunicola CBS 121167]
MSSEVNNHAGESQNDQGTMKKAVVLEDTMEKIHALEDTPAPSEPSNVLDPGTEAIIAALNDLRDSFNAHIDGLRDDIKALRADMREGPQSRVYEDLPDLTGVRSDIGALRSGIGGVRSDIAAGFGGVRSNIAAVRLDLGHVRYNLTRGFRDIRGSNWAPAEDNDLTGASKDIRNSSKNVRDEVKGSKNASIHDPKSSKNVKETPQRDQRGPRDGHRKPKGHQLISLRNHSTARGLDTPTVDGKVNYDELPYIFKYEHQSDNGRTTAPYNSKKPKTRLSYPVDCYYEWEADGSARLVTGDPALAKPEPADRVTFSRDVRDMPSPDPFEASRARANKPLHPKRSVLTGGEIPHFPNTPADIKKMPSEQLDIVLKYLNVNPTGDVQTKRLALEWDFGLGLFT